jgi:hypothetical protein
MMKKHFLEFWEGFCGVGTEMDWKGFGEFVGSLCIILLAFFLVAGGIVGGFFVIAKGITSLTS